MYLTNLQKNNIGRNSKEIVDNAENYQSKVSIIIVLPNNI